MMSDFCPFINTVRLPEMKWRVSSMSVWVCHCGPYSCDGEGTCWRGACQTGPRSLVTTAIHSSHTSKAFGCWRHAHGGQHGIQTKQTFRAALCGGALSRSPVLGVRLVHLTSGYLLVHAFLRCFSSVTSQWECSCGKGKGIRNFNLTNVEEAKQTQLKSALLRGQSGWNWGQTATERETEPFRAGVPLGLLVGNALSSQ